MCTFAPAWKDRGVAQLVAFLVWDQAVAGSSPVTSTTYIGKRPLIHNELAVFFLFFPRNPVFLGCFRGKMGEKIRVLVNLFLQIKFDSFTILNR